MKRLDEQEYKEALKKADDFEVSFKYARAQTPRKELYLISCALLDANEKGEELCQYGGNLGIELHDIKKENKKLRDVLDQFVRECDCGTRNKCYHGPYFAESAYKVLTSKGSMVGVCKCHDPIVGVNLLCAVCAKPYRGKEK